MWKETRERLTTQTRLRRSRWTGRLILQVFVHKQVKVRSVPSERNLPYKPWPGHPNPAQYIREDKARIHQEQEACWETVKKYYRDANENDLITIGNKGNFLNPFEIIQE